MENNRASDARAGSSGKNLPDSLFQAAVSLWAMGMAAFFAFERIWEGNATVIYSTAGRIGIVVIGCCLLYDLFFHRLPGFRGRGKKDGLTRRIIDGDTGLFLGFFIYALLACLYLFGFSYAFFESRYFQLLMVFISFYFAAKTAPEPNRLFAWFSFAYVLSLTGVCLSILINATRSLLTRIPGHDTIRGCFQLGRLCGFGNVNFVGFACVALVMGSVFALLYVREAVKEADRERAGESGEEHFAAGENVASGWMRLKRSLGKGLSLLYLATALTGWFCLGLSGCRTGYIGLSFGLGLIAFCAVRIRKKGMFRSLFTGIVVFLLLLVSFQLPTPLYQKGMTVYADRAHQAEASQNVQKLVTRSISKDNGTMSDRTLIWEKAVAVCFKNTRRALLGITPLSSDEVEGVYDGHHEITIAHAHNVILELLRVFGIIGLLFWLGLLVLWGSKALRLLFSPHASLLTRTPAALWAGILLMGLTEPVPLTTTSPGHLAILFFTISGVLMKADRF